MADNKNVIVAIALSIAILIGWNYYFAPKPLAPQQAQQQTAEPAKPAAPASAPAGTASADAPVQAETREAALAASPRLPIDSARLRGSIALRGGDIDDIVLKDYRETVDPHSPNIVVFSPGNGPGGYFGRTGWLPAAGVEVPNAQTVWRADAANLTEEKPVTLTWDNGKGYIFKRMITIDKHYMLTVTDMVEATSGAETALAPYGLIRRIGAPHVGGYYILHEGLLGVVGDQGLKEFTYANLDKETARTATEKGKEYPNAVGGWAGVTDKYWASAIIPDQKTPFNVNFTVNTAPGAAAVKSYQTLVTLPPLRVAQGQPASVTNRVFVGAKEVQAIDAYEKDLGILLFDRVIDWGIFYWITKNLFLLIDAIYTLVGNFGVAILIVTLLVKAVFFPLANKSYASMAKMKAVQPQMQALKEQYPDDKVKQQQELMEIYKREKINPLAGCLPVIIQIPVFFALYKVLFVTIEMRQAPFFGWIKDLSAPDPTSVFNLFGLVPWHPPSFMMIGIWPLIMGVTMFVQMKMNPEPPDPVQKTMFTWMPVIFTYMLASFPAGLVIYWSWNNTLSVTQQYMIMKRQGVKVELWDNLAGVFGLRKAAPKPGQ